MTFEEQFPSLTADDLDYDERGNSQPIYVWKSSVMSKCLDKQKVRDTINKLQAALEKDVAQYDNYPSYDVDNFKKELGL
jgi:hypothetical protein